ncbi:glycoside hydrolase domain-containing protein [Sporolactobacillus spathodeae]|uniref:Peptidoglycan hydrolase-like protein with peptidoglycan-binding domain n=1 Tax=Sporolactobacillus spathodeae TaxID=1465502 RepID=A0ABS2Q8H9_9BACL|nr:glycoside hydrolase domain-containing protein [Sporolactobacillus spathodeae]MBM7658087.1 peptidoglycan hydrolase-like protein with peptidoglycan-binding domain [Sporolactobacillus spathodeae]
MKGVDCARRLTPVSAKKLKAAGFDGIGRYLGPPDSWKTLTKEEVSAATSAGLRLFSIWEKAPTDAAYFTRTQASIDAREAAYWARLLGQPVGTPIFFTVDYNASPKELSVIRSYFFQLHRYLSAYTIGAYGSLSVINALHLWQAADCFFQTAAWSAGQKSAHADIYQFKNNQHAGGLIVDWNEIYNDAVLWPLPVCKNRYPGHLIRINSHGNTVRLIQKTLGIRSDGLFGPETERAVRNFQKIKKLQVDGVIGPQTWAALF